MKKPQVYHYYFSHLVFLPALFYVCLTLQAPISWYYDKEIVLCVIMLLYSHYINVTLAQWCWRCLWRLFIGEVIVVSRARQHGAPCSLRHQLLSIFMLSKASASITGCDGHAQMRRRDERQWQMALKKKKKKIVKRRWYRPLAPDASVWLLFFLFTHGCRDMNTRRLIMTIWINEDKGPRGVM